VAVLFSILTGCAVFGQTPTWDNTGNNLLSGPYYFREVAWVASAANGGALSDAVALYGTITFSGSAPGTYTISAQYLDGAAGQITSQTISGTYSIGAGGFGFLSHPLQSGSVIRGMVSNGIFMGSCTESGSFNDLFIAGQIPIPSPTAASFSGAYSMSYVNYSSTNVQYFEDAQFTLNPNGAGSLGTVSLRGFYAGNGTTVTGQVSSNVKYIASGGAIVMTFPAATQNTLSLVNGQEYLYFSPDGNFVFGGAPNGFDMMIGVRTTSGGAPQLMADNSVYYNAGFYSDATSLASGALDLDSYYGSFNLSGGTVIQHSRLFSTFTGIYSAVTTGAAPTTAGATYDDPYTSFTIGNGGNVRIGFGKPPYLGIDIALLAPVPAVTGPVVLNPLGVVNAGSYAPFTTGLSPGELIVLTGTNLAPAGPLKVATTAIFPNILNNVQVLIDGIPAPLYYVSATQIAAIVPYASSTFGIATIQVKNNGVVSNIVTEFVNSTTPGVLTSPANGISDAAALHADYTLITEKSPAQQGETISVYLTGLGGVFPPVQDGYPGSSDPSSLNKTVATIAALVGGQTATVGYAGLAPGYAGLYQINITIPTGLTAGDNLLDIEGPDSYASEALIPVAASTGINVPLGAGAEVQNGQTQKPAQHRKPRPSQKSIVVKPIEP
jgi:uncharacterized protein (TIGR03437 family)